MRTEVTGEGPGFGQVLLTELRAIMERRNETPSDDGPFPSVDAEQGAWKRAVDVAQSARKEKLRSADWAADKLTEEQAWELWKVEQDALAQAWEREQGRAEEAQTRRGAAGAEAATERERQRRTQANGAHQELARQLRQQGASAGLLAELWRHLDRELEASVAGPGGARYTEAQMEATLEEVEGLLRAQAQAEQRGLNEAELQAVQALRAQFRAELEARARTGRPESAREGSGAERDGTVREAEEAAEVLVARARREALGMDLFGLALSGGGIRSATFNLGVLQGLARMGLLKRLDYLSTVSGGGYIGGWLAAWVKREGNVRHVEKQLRPARWQEAEGRQEDRRQVYEEEPEPVFHLRSYSNYLAPRPGLLSADGWVGASIYLRNLLLNQLLLLPALMMLLLATRLALLFYEWEGGTWEAPTGAWLCRLLAVRHWAVFWYLVIGAVFVAALWWAAWRISVALERVRVTRQGRQTNGADLRDGKRQLYFHVLVPIVVAAFLAGWFVWDNPDPARIPWLRGWLEAYVPRLLGPSPYARTALVFAAGFGFFFGLLHLVFAALYARSFLWSVGGALAGAASGAAAGALVGALLVFTEPLFVEGNWADMACEAATVLTVGPPLGLLVFVLGAFVQVGLLGRHLDEDAREWWASLCGRLLLIAVGWAAVCAISFFSVPLLLWAGPAARAAVGAGWLTAALSGLLAAGGPRTGAGPAAPGRANWGRELLARTIPYVILVGLLVGLSYLLSLVVDLRPPPEVAAVLVKHRRTPAKEETPTTHTHTRPTVQGPGASENEIETETFTELLSPTDVAIWQYWAGLLYTGYNPLEDKSPLRPDENRFLVKERWWLWVKVLVGMVVCGLVLAVASLRVDINVFSLHGTYGSRLVRCYLGASREKVAAQTDRLHGVRPNSAGPPRSPDPITGFDPNDDFPLHDLAPGPRVPWGGRDLPSRRRPYWGPYLLVNTAMNLVEGDELAWQERKAESFVLTPEFCGSKSTGYRPLPGYGDNLSLGTAVTISGAAASPNMGYHSSPAVTALLTVFNVRLGAWLGNPRKPTWEHSSPAWSFGPLFQELFGRTDLHYDYLYLSDGGHFENLGVYELVRRRCRYILVCDAGQDGDYAFDDLGDMIRKCRSDFGVPIEIDVTQLRPQGETGRSQWHCAVGKVRYDCVHPDAVPGLLVYLKASLTGDEPQDVLNYKAKHPNFPHQSTGNQFFTESQFESYRALGEHILEEVFEDAMRGVDATAEMSDAAHRRVVRQLFANLHRRWFPPPPRLEESYLESVKACIDLEAALREDQNLANFSQALYPESQADATVSPAPGAPAVPPPAAPAGQVRAEIHAVSQMLQVMADAWLGVRLEGHNAHPMNRGWMNALRRWTSSEVFRRYWLLLRGEYSWDFVRFCETELGLDPGRPVTDRKQNVAAVRAVQGWAGLCEQFAAEWPGVGGAAGLDSLVDAADTLDGDFHVDGESALPVWVVTLSPAGGLPAGAAPPPDYACGVVLLWQPPKLVPDFELVVWLRGAYRNLGIGRECLGGLLGDIRRGLPPQRGRHLRVRFPGMARAGSGKRMQKEMWLRFFSQYGLHRNVYPRAAAPEDLVLEREYYPVED